MSRGARVLEIGCGWGGLAEVAAREFGAQVTGVTLSSEQLAWGQQRLQARGLAEHAELRLQDYRDLAARHEAEPFDAIVSIEMFEAVGREYWDSYFDTLRRCLKPGGRACIQSITIRDDLFERYVRSTDFIQQYVFPGGLLPSVSAFEAAGSAGRLHGRARAGLRARLRRDPEALAHRLRCNASMTSAGSASTRVSCGSGTSIWPIAKRPSCAATPMSCSSRCGGIECPIPR